jgi:hypothetical protein
MPAHRIKAKAGTELFIPRNTVLLSHASKEREDFWSKAGLEKPSEGFLASFGMTAI